MGLEPMISSARGWQYTKLTYVPDAQRKWHNITFGAIEWKVKAGQKGFDPLTTGLEVQHSIHAELPAQRFSNL